ncbi:hypothetical protein GCM10025865_21700 [Paraoerskovia sediminicola]|uniref:UDP-glucose/GDP-mannose dehydrogenase N-terminal domain-containing protein n=1 Tax=Paraoerskovia sediminicola TaxID=1138587 RepID=A0ABN6XGX1_9CELL|nr:hypothetical protein GCM10025865_21700 [Paraoerskovia sediminicola]
MTDIGNVTVVGLGYIGLPTAAILAESGVRVQGMDVSERTIDAVGRGEVPFVEPDLAGFVARAVAAGLLTASTEVLPADVYVIAVPTPFNDDRTPDLSYIEAASKAVAPTLTSDALVVLESTSPPGPPKHCPDGSPRRGPISSPTTGGRSSMWRTAPSACSRVGS